MRDGELKTVSITAYDCDAIFLQIMEEKTEYESDEETTKSKDWEDDSEWESKVRKETGWIALIVKLQ
jgi:hypothetical protein